MEFSLLLWICSFLPVVLLVVGISYLKLSSQKTALFALLLTVILALGVYQLEVGELLISVTKGSSLALYVILIIVGAILLYNVVELAGAFESIKEFMLSLNQDKALQVLALSWAVAPFIQGISGFGVPVAVVGSLLVGMGFNAIVAVTAVLIGHSWSIVFGSMGSSFYALGLVTGLEIRSLALITTLLFFVPIFLTGFSVVHLYKSENNIKYPHHLNKYILIIGSLMGLTKVLTAYLNFPHLGSLLAGLVGSGLFILSFNGAKAKLKPDLATKEETTETMAPLFAITPYFVLIISVLFFQLPAIKNRLPELALSFDFPGFTTALGYQVEAESSYAAVELFSHPVTFLIFSAIIGAILFYRRGYLKRPQDVISSSIKQSLSSGTSILFLMVMALVMSDAGMLYVFADGLVRISGSLFPFFTPAVGVLGAFLTGSTTSSNVLFGGLQLRAAELLNLSPYLVISGQAVGASLGSAIAPAKILLGVVTVGAEGKEGVILAKALFYTSLITVVMGFIVLAMVNIF